MRNSIIRRPASALSGVLVLAAGLLSAVGAGAEPAVGQTDGSPKTVVKSFLSAWSRQDWSTMQRLVDTPTPSFRQENQAALSQLAATRTSYSAGTVTTSGDRSTARVTEHFAIPVIGTYSAHTTIHLRDRSGRWLVEWSPTTMDSSIPAGAHLATTYSWPARAAILGAGGLPLSAGAPMVTVGVEGSFVKNPSTLSAALVAAGATSTEVQSALTAAKAHPSYFEPVFTVTEPRYLALKSKIYNLPGTVFQATSDRHAITPGLESHLVGSVGPITAQELNQLGAPYNASSVVGQTGLEQVDERQLAGTPGATLAVVGSNGVTLKTIERIAPKPGRPVSTSIDPTVQRAAEAALATEPKASALVAVRASTGQVLASVSDPAAGGFDQALDGTFPPGSTFKTITSTALFEGGLSPASAATCPPTLTVGGALFHNAEGDTPVSSLGAAFTESCNTAFIGLATKHLGLSSLPAAAALYDIGKTPQMGIPAFGGSVPRPNGVADLAETSIGQGRVLVSPLGMAMVAAAIDSGVVREPRLVAGAPDDTAATTRLPKNIVAELRQMMAQVVATGTAAGQGLPPGTDAKTGTAEYGTGNPLPTDAWLIGFHGDIAFAMLVVDGGLGGPTDGPIVARFLTALGTHK